MSISFGQIIQYSHDIKNKINRNTVFVFVAFILFSIDPIGGFAQNDNFSKTECILLIHGFGGSPYDLKPLTNVLDTMNVDFIQVLLAGHGTRPSDLINIQYKTWISDCFEIYDSLSNEYNRIVLIGFSMGGAICQIISTQRNVSKLVLLSPYYRIHQKWYYFGNPAKWAKRVSFILPYIKKLKIGQINDPLGLKKYNAYDRLPLKAVGELVKVGNRALEEGNKVDCPILWMHSKGDIVSDYHLSRDTFNNNKSSDKTFIEFTRSNHILLYDYDSEEVISQILIFLYGENNW